MKLSALGHAFIGIAISVHLSSLLICFLLRVGNRTMVSLIAAMDVGDSRHAVRSFGYVFLDALILSEVDAELRAGLVACGERRVWAPAFVARPT